MHSTAARRLDSSAQRPADALINGMDAPTLHASVCAKVDSVEQPLNQVGASEMNITTVGIDLAKNVFQIHGVDERGKMVLRKQLKPCAGDEFLVNLPACLIGMEAVQRAFLGSPTHGAGTHGEGDGATVCEALR